MSSPQIESRKKLLPKKPSRVLKKRKTFVAYSRRDYGLTNDQQLWARSLALSLSGWRNRQDFLKAQLEGHLKDEVDKEAREVSQKAALKAPKDKHQSYLTGLQAKALRQHAKKTTGVCQDNVEDMTEDELCDKENEYSCISELQDPALSAKEEIKEYRIKDRLAPESTIVVSPDAEHARKQSIKIFQPTTNLRSLSNTPAVAVVDWRFKAHNGIMKKKLSMGKRWSAVTWNQKSNVQERLLLLECDGFDISELQHHKVSSEEITKIILERIAAREISKTVELSVQKPEKPKASSKEDQDSLPVLRGSDIDTSTSPSALLLEISPETQLLPKAQLCAGVFSAPSNQFMQTSKPQSAITSTIEDDTAPFTPHRSYQPRPSPRLKRKRDFEDPDELAATSHPALKKRKTESVVKDELQPNALQEIKRKVLRRIFRPARSICRKPSVPSRVIFSRDKTCTNRREGKSISTLDYLYTRQLTSKELEGSLFISSRGYNNMMAEISFLTNTSPDKDDGLFIYNPDCDEVTGHVEDRIENRMGDFFRRKSCVTILKDQQGHSVFQGDTLTLAELFKVLREQELLHRVDWKWEGINLSPSSSMLWSLSPETQIALAEVERRLRRYARTGGVEIVVGRTDDGRSS